MFGYENSLGYEIIDECYAVVSGRCGNGVFLTLDNGQSAYAYQFGNLTPGDQVICRIDKLPQADRKARVSISSVCSYGSSCVRQPA